MSCLFYVCFPFIFSFKYWSQEKKQVEESIEKHRNAVKEAIEVHFMRCPISFDCESSVTSIVEP